MISEIKSNTIHHNFLIYQKDKSMVKYLASFCVLPYEGGCVGLNKGLPKNLDLSSIA